MEKETFTIVQNPRTKEVHLYSHLLGRCVCNYKCEELDSIKVELKLNALGKSHEVLDVHQTRAVVLALRELGYDVCGTCVSHLYRTEK
jgi:hypothetical protein